MSDELCVHATLGALGALGSLGALPEHTQWLNQNQDTRRHLVNLGCHLIVFGTSRLFLAFRRSTAKTP
jgi:hypothetical protein